MSTEQQLERSVLEGKERDELQAIAEAMALKPGSRARKAVIIDEILRATGIGVPGGDNGGATTASNGASPPIRPRDTAPAGQGTPATGDTPVTGDKGVATRAEVTSGDQEHPALPMQSSADVPSDAGQRAASEAAGSGLARSPRVGTGRGSNGSDERAGQTTPSHEQFPSAPVSSGQDQGGQDQGGQDQGGQDQGGHGPDQEAPTQAQAGPSHAHRGQGGSQPGGSQPGGGQPGGGQPGGGQQGGGQHGDAGAELGNRRSRRRGRGRDRERGERTERTERSSGDLQGSANDAPFQGEPVAVTGLLDLHDKGYGFLRTHGFLANARDVYISMSQVRRFGLRKGDHIEGTSRPAGSSETYPALLRVDTVSGMTPEEANQRPRFEDLTPLFPDERLNLEVPGDSANMTARIVDLLSPIGKGQRGLIVSPPKAGKTTVLKQIAHSIEANNPEVHLMVLLVDERPEEVTDMRRSVKGEVVASTFDRPSEEHTAVAELAIERAKRMVECGKDVVIVLDGITRLARAYNLAQPATGRIMSGGVDSGALYPPKKFFGSARNIEEGGSLTILATALVETGSRMDEVIFEEFKGTGNLELRLDRRLAERRIYPAIDVNASSTRHEELLFGRSQLQQVWKLRRVLNALGSEGSGAAGLELLMDKIRTTSTNDQFLSEIAKGPTP